MVMDQTKVPKKDSSTQVVISQELQRAFSQPTVNPVAFVNGLIRESINFLASDLLFEPAKEKLRVRVRVDGVLYDLGKVNLGAYEQVSSRIKVMAKLDPTEKRTIQEGQFTVDHEGRIVNLRIEIAQTVHGELIVIRIHERSTIVMELSQLGFSEKGWFCRP